MPNKASSRFPLLLLVLSMFVSVRAAGQSQSNFGYGPLPVFELHSGFWINLHHTLYHEAKLRTTTAGSPDKSGRTSSPALNTAPGAKASLTPSEQRIWDDAVAYYAANYAAKDLLFSSELIQLKDQVLGGVISSIVRDGVVPDSLFRGSERGFRTRRGVQSWARCPAAFVR